MKRYGAALLAFLLTIPVYAQFKDSLRYKEPPSLAARLLPGGTHFHDGNLGKGLFFATAETGLFASAILFNDELKSGNSSEYYNYPFILGQQLYGIDKADFYLRELNQVMASRSSLRYEIPSFSQMLSAPFRPEVLKEPLVWGVAGFAVLENVLMHVLGERSKTLAQVQQVHGYGNTFNTEWGSAVYGATGSLVSLGAGVSEEMIFRGYLQPILHLNFGPEAGLWGSTLLFTAGHFPSFLKIKDPVVLAWSVSQMTALSYLFGLNARNNHYDIQPAIAAHAWYDIAIMFSAWALDPANNPLGFRVSFKIP